MESNQTCVTLKMSSELLVLKERKISTQNSTQFKKESELNIASTVSIFHEKIKFVLIHFEKIDEHEHE